MSSYKINDLAATTDLDQAAMAGIRGGMDVQIGSVSSSIRSTDDNSVLSTDLLGKLVNIAIDGIQQQSQKGTPR
jgi:hypothetical protein